MRYTSIIKHTFRYIFGKHAPVLLSNANFGDRREKRSLWVQVCFGFCKKKERLLKDLKIKEKQIIGGRYRKSNKKERFLCIKINYKFKTIKLLQELFNDISMHLYTAVSKIQLAAEWLGYFCPFVFVFVLLW